MASNEISTRAYELKTSTESDFTVILNGIYEYTTTMNPLDFHITDKVPESTTEVVDGMFVLYGLGGILIFFVIYVLFYRYILHCKDVAERQETELRELNERNARAPYRRPVNRDRIFIEDFNQRRNANLTTPTTAESSCIQRNPEHLNVKNGGEQKNTRLVDLAPIHHRDSQYVSERKQMSEDDTNTTIREVAETSGTVTHNSEKPETLGRVESWMSEPPLCFSTPQDSVERLYFPEDFQDLLCPNATQMQKYQSSNEYKSDADNATPTTCEKLLPSTPDKSAADNASPTKVEKQSPPTPKGESRSSPSSPDIIRRRVTTLEDSPRRPFSWQ